MSRKKVPGLLIGFLVLCLVIGIVDLTLLSDSVPREWVRPIVILNTGTLIFLVVLIYKRLTYKLPFSEFLRDRQVGYMAFTDVEVLTPCLEAVLSEYLPCHIWQQEFQGVGGLGYLKSFSRARGKVSQNLFLAAEILDRGGKQQVQLFLIDLRAGKMLVAGASMPCDEIKNLKQAIRDALGDIKLKWMYTPGNLR